MRIRNYIEYYRKEALERFDALEKAEQERQKPWYEKAKELQKGGTKIIRNREQFHHVASSIRKVPGQACNIASLSMAITEKGGISGRVETTSFAAGRLTEYSEPLLAPYDTSCVVPIVKNVVNSGKIEQVSIYKPRHIERHFHGLISLEVSEPVLVLLDWCEGKIYRRNQHTKGVYYERWFMACGEDWLDLLTGKIWPKSQTGLFDAEGNLREDVFIYDYKSPYCSVTPGSLKRKEILIPCVNMPGFNFKEIANELTCGMMERLEILLNTCKIDSSRKLIAQQAARYGQWRAPQFDMLFGGEGAITCHCLYTGKFSLKIEEAPEYWDGTDEIAVEGGEVEAEIMDGEGIMTKSFVTKVFNMKLAQELGFVNKDHKYPKCFVMPDAVLGSHGQKRANMDKMKDKVVDEFYVKLILERLMSEKKAEVLIFPMDHWNENWQLAMDKKIVLKDKKAVINYHGKEVDLNNKLIIFATDEELEGIDLENPDLDELFMRIQKLVDLNACKSTFRYNKLSGMNLMALEHTTGVAHTSTQTLTTEAKCGTEWAKELMAEVADGVVEDKLDKLMAEAPLAPTEADIVAGGITLANAFDKACPKWNKEIYSAGWQANAQKTLSSFIGDFDNLRFEVEGFEEYMSPDPSAYFGFRVLPVAKGQGKVLCPDLKKDQKSILVKYPKMGSQEFFKAVGMDELDYILKVIQQCDNPDYIWALWREVTHLHHGVCFLPAYTCLNQLMAGYDNDGDHAMAYTWKRLVKKVFKRLSSKVVDIDLEDNWKPVV